MTNCRELWRILYWQAIPLMSSLRFLFLGDGGRGCLLLEHLEEVSPGARLQPGEQHKPVPGRQFHWSSENCPDFMGLSTFFSATARCAVRHFHHASLAPYYGTFAFLYFEIHPVSLVLFHSLLLASMSRCDTTQETVSRTLIFLPQTAFSQL